MPCVSIQHNQVYWLSQGRAIPTFCYPENIYHCVPPSMSSNNSSNSLCNPPSSLS